MFKAPLRLLRSTPFTQLRCHVMMCNQLSPYRNLALNDTTFLVLQIVNSRSYNVFIYVIKFHCREGVKEEETTHKGREGIKSRTVVNKHHRLQHQ